ncbi:OmpA-like periplasmic protein [Croceitalea dokdonensis DOKDO 023]|uniref:OmpA-like periplasmic protein n=1 Tax=Croceitalea dokdonensis DOKDO 023 TaxID=1300341 RepID=A0A0P7AGK3_9FLAO|nr:DUF5723 family protein [Croceitalea dokdonensis]KPM31110.1 OmpA-like periplasmic protein [Croceitalea dokdonensis DOKDO 023]
MKKYGILFTLLSVICVQGQSFLGYASDNFNGIHGTVINPANSADSRTKVDVNVLTTETVLGTDYTNLTLGNIIDLLGEEGFTGLERFPADNNRFLVGVDINGPSVQISLGEKQSIALLSRVRFAGNINNINGNLFESIYDGFTDENFVFSQDNFNQTIHAWGELGLSYARVLIPETNNSFLKGGVTLKYLLGGGFAQGNSNTLNGAYDFNVGTVSLNGDFSYATNIDEDTSTDFFNELTGGFGADIGFVYEYRNNSSVAAANGRNPRGFNLYKFKVGLALLDIGSITYNNVTTNAYAVNGTVNAQDLEDDFEQTFEDSFQETVTTGDVTISLPTTLRLQLDYNVVPKVYLNLDLAQNVTDQNDALANQRLNFITFTPRYESRGFATYVPVTFSELGGTNIGFGLRLGPLVIGSGTLVSNLFTDTANAANIYAGLRVPIYHKRN